MQNEQIKNELNEMELELVAAGKDSPISLSQDVDVINRGPVGPKFPPRPFPKPFPRF